MWFDMIYSNVILFLLFRVLLLPFMVWYRGVLDFQLIELTEFLENLLLCSLVSYGLGFFKEK